MPRTVSEALDVIDQLRQHRERKFVTAALCAVLTRLQEEVIPSPGSNLTKLDMVLNSIDYGEAGFTRKEIEAWWLHQRAEDHLRRERAMKERVDEDLRRGALAKLSPAERKLLRLE